MRPARCFLAQKEEDNYASFWRIVDPSIAISSNFFLGTLAPFLSCSGQKANDVIREF